MSRTIRELVEVNRLQYQEEKLLLLRKFYVYHYKNDCEHVGTVGVAPNTEFLTGDRKKVNCPWCLQRMSRRKR